MKKLFVLGLVILVLSLSVCFAVSFSDVAEDHWAYKTINNMKEKGILNGYEDGTFKPDKEVTREEFVQILYKSINSPKIYEENLQNYYDVPSSRWSYNPVQYLGYSLKETSDGYTYFYPERPILREEVAVILSDVFDLAQTTDAVEFVDKDAISAKYTDAVQNVANSGLMIGNENKEFSPKKSLTRAEASTLITRFLESQGKIINPEPVEESVDLDVAFLKLENKKANLIYSPLSIKYALKMLDEGADGNTKKQIDALVAKYDLTKYASSKNLSLANAIFVKDTYKDKVLPDYTNTLKSKYDAEVIYDSFKSAAAINGWIENKTLNLIKNMLRDDEVKEVKMILANALAIDMEWALKFSDESTYAREFTKADGKKIQATTMCTSTSYDGYVENFKPTNSFSYYIDEDIQAISKDLKEYDGNTLEYVAIMPRKEALIDFTNNITTEKLTEIINKIEPVDKKTFDKNIVTVINLYLPKFKFEYDLDFDNELKKLGMTDAFNPDIADFSKMSDPQIVSFYVDKAKHKALIEFSEDGIKAAAVTLFMMKENSVAIDPKEYKYININYDHPYMFLIRDKKTGEIWFVGTVYEPNLWENDKAEYGYKY